MLFQVNMRSDFGQVIILDKKFVKGLSDKGY